MDNQTILAITTGHMLIWIIAYRLKKGKLDPFDPYYISTGLYFMIFVYAPWIWINRGQTAYQGIQVMEYLPIATVVFNIAYAAFSLFSLLNIKFKSRKKRISSISGEDDEFQVFLDDDVTRAYISKYGLIVFLVSFLMALTYYMLTGRSLLFMLTLGQGSEFGAGRVGEGIYFMAQFIRSAIPGILLLFAFTREKRYLIYIGAYMLCAVCISSGSRNLAICVVLALVVYQYLQKGERPSKLTIVAGVVAMYLFVGFVGLFRGSMRMGGNINLAIMNKQSLFTAFMFNVEIFYPFYTLIGYLNRGYMPYHYGLGVLNIPIQFIPHALWPTKPATLGLTAFEAMYGNSMGGAAYPNIGEFYYEFGLFGAIVGMAVFGNVAQKKFSFAKKTKNKLSMVEYSIFFGYLMQFICRGHFASWALDIVFMFGPIWFLKRRLCIKYITWKAENNNLIQT